MAHTARKDAEKKEHFDPPDVVEQKVETLAQWVKESNHFITFTVSQRRVGARSGGHATNRAQLAGKCIHDRYVSILS